MSVLTPEEVEIMKSHRSRTVDGDARILKKLTTFQASVTTRDHVAAVNRFIPRAEAVANKQCNANGRVDKDMWDRVYHQEMNRLTREAGLRI